jgi:hypothetical protein
MAGMPGIMGGYIVCGDGCAGALSSSAAPPEAEKVRTKDAKKMDASLRMGEIL